jgi:superoxide reductase
MKRRDFFSAAAGIGAAGVLAGSSQSAMAADRPAEKRLQVYKCNECGSILGIIAPGGDATLVHCGKPMELLEEQTAVPAENKHVPIIERVDGGFKVTVGSTPHPMTESHYIMWIDLIAGEAIHRQFLHPGDKPEATFCVEAKEVSAREYCNLHGLWKDK